MRRTIGRQAIGVVLLAALPTFVDAQTQTTQVPAIARAAATAEAAVGGPLAPEQVTRPSAARRMPRRYPRPDSSRRFRTGPGLHATADQLVSPSAPLDAKEQHAVAIGAPVGNRREMPQPGEDGVVRFLYGATLPTVVCAPLQVCDLALQPGEIVNNVQCRRQRALEYLAWHQRSPGARSTHLIIKPTDAGLVSSMTIETNQRTYAVKLVSTEAQWMPLVGVQLSR